MTTKDSDAVLEERHPSRRSIYAIAAAVGAANVSDNFWVPFLPLFVLQIGAKDEADALFWVATASAVLGVTRLLTGPFWGVLADRVGRKAMFLRALFLTGACNVLMGVVSDPWQIVVIYGLYGVFSGYIPASVALTSVSVPESQIGRSLGIVTSGQYLGNSIGPLAGSLIILVLDYRGAILLGSVIPMIASLAVLLVVPDDRPRRARSSAAASEPSAPLEPFRPTFQLLLAIVVYFVVFSGSQFVRLLSPIALRGFDAAGADEAIGLTFTAGGLASAASLLFLAPKVFRVGTMRSALVRSTAIGIAFLIILASAGGVPQFALGFALYSLVQAAMITAANTLIAANVSRARRGTAFGLASSAHALAFMVGPFSAAFFAGFSIAAGYLALAGILGLLGIVLLARMREPAPASSAVAA